LAAHLVAGLALGRRHLLDVHGHVFLGAHRLGVRTDPAVDGSLAYGRSIFDDPPLHSKERTLRGIFYLLLYRGVRGERKGWRWTWGIAALSCAAGYSLLDEIHQAFVASRTASPYDSLLDSIGSFAAFGVLWMWFRWRRSARETEIAPNEVPSA
jgi:hypothetical protein